MPIYTIDQMRQLEASADAAGHSYDAMMEAAGNAVARLVMSRAREGTPRRKILVLAGPGNNGGDGLVAARYLAQAGHKVVALAWQRPSPDPQGEAAKTAGVALTTNLQRLPTILSQIDGVIDALFGTGLSRPIEGEAADVLQQVAAARQHHDFDVIGVDGPSGLHGDTGEVDPVTVSSDVTITFAGPKIGMIAPQAVEVTGQIQVAAIGIPDEVEAQAESVAEWLELPTVVPYLPRRVVSGHKGTFGTVMVIGGSVNYIGAPALAAVAAGRSGVGYVTLAVPMAIQPMLAARPDLTTATWLPLQHDFGAVRKEAAKTVHEAVDKASALVVGPGLGHEETTREFVYTLLGITQPEYAKRTVGFVGFREANPPPPPALNFPPMVIDADALNALAAYEGEWWRTFNGTAVLTPHPGELGRLLDIEAADIQSARLAHAREAAERFGQVVVLKGAYTVVAAPDGRVAVNSVATSALAKAGAGDVLSGVIAALLAQGVAPFEAACLGVVVHGRAGVQLATTWGEQGGLASDLLDLIGWGWRDFQ